GTHPRLHVVDFGPVLDALRAGAQPKYWQVVLKRLMYRAADHIAQEVGAGALVTGEALGQVSSQTLANPAANGGARRAAVLRPLLGFDKAEIVDHARRIGTFEISARVKEYCAIAPGNPVTHASAEAAASEEAAVDPGPLARAIAERKVIDLQALNTADLVDAYLYTDELPEDAVVIDVRAPGEGDPWQYPGAPGGSSWDIAQKIREMDPERIYVIYCDAALQAVPPAAQITP